MTAPTLDAFIWMLEQHVYDPDSDQGDIERPLGSNNVPGVTDFCGCNANWCAWCNMLLSTVYTILGEQHNCWSVPLERINGVNGVNGWEWVEPGDIERGDWPVYDWDGDGVPDHIGCCISRLGVNSMHTVEGNVADRCLDQVRTMFGVMGAVRPVYSPAAAPTPEPVPQPDPPAHLTKKEQHMYSEIIKWYAYAGKKETPNYKEVSGWMHAWEEGGEAHAWDAFMAAAIKDGRPVPQ